MRDAKVPLRRSHRRWPAPGFTLLELLVVVSMTSVLLAIALPRMPRGAFGLWNVDRQLLADIRQARADSLTKGDHFRVRVTASNAYEVARMRFAGGVWTPVAPPLRTRVLPSGITFTQGVGALFEFNTRGLMVTTGAAARIEVTDSRSGDKRYITVFPSGQVAPL